jgi:hypothetical protein
MISKMDILKLVPPKILARFSLMFITYTTTTSNTRKDLLILSEVIVSSLTGELVIFFSLN